MSQEEAPPDPEDERPRPLMGPGFWAMIALCALCVLAGAGVAVLAPKLWKPEPPPPAADAARAPADKDRQDEGDAVGRSR